MNVKEAAEFIRWYGHGSNCLADGAKQKFQLARRIVEMAPVIMTIAKGRASRGPLEIIAVTDRGEIAFRDMGDTVGWGCHFCRFEIGGLSRPIGQMVLGEGSPSQFITNSDMGLYGLALTPADAQTLGLIGPEVQVDAPAVRAMFGSNVEVV